MINDLFPGIVLEKAGYPQLEGFIQKNVEESGYVYHAPWVLKVIQVKVLFFCLLKKEKEKKNFEIIFSMKINTRVSKITKMSKIYQFPDVFSVGKHFRQISKNLILL